MIAGPSLHICQGRAGLEISAKHLRFRFSFPFRSETREYVPSILRELEDPDCVQ